VSEALATLPWVEPSSIQADRRTRQAKFTVKDRTAFDMAAVQEVIHRAGYRRTHLLKGPTES
jgi:hypothetical protein